MARDSGSPPRQTTQQFVANDQVAQQQGGSTQPVRVCSNWTLRLSATGRTDARKTTFTTASLEVEWQSGKAGTESRQGAASAPAQVAAAPIVDHGAASGVCRATAKGWYLEAEQSVTLGDGDNKAIDLVMLPAPWVVFEARDHRSNALLGDVRLKTRWDKLGETEARTPPGAALDFEHEALRPGDSCELLEVGHDAIVYEVVGALESS